MAILAPEGLRSDTYKGYRGASAADLRAQEAAQRRMGTQSWVFKYPGTSNTEIVYKSAPPVTVPPPVTGPPVTPPRPSLQPVVPVGFFSPPPFTPPSIPKVPPPSPFPPSPRPGGAGGGGSPSPPAAAGGGIRGGGILFLIGLAFLASFGKRK